MLHHIPFYRKGGGGAGGGTTKMHFFLHFPSMNVFKLKGNGLDAIEKHCPEIN